MNQPGFEMAINARESTINRTIDTWHVSLVVIQSMIWLQAFLSHSAPWKPGATGWFGGEEASCDQSKYTPRLTSILKIKMPASYWSLLDQAGNLHDIHTRMTPHMKLFSRTAGTQVRHHQN
ncbi:Thiol protease, partial [Fusarium oxysporum f. sp. albedinis]